MKMKIMAILALVIGSFTTFGIQCTMCRQTMLESDKYCPNCGRERSEEPPAVQKQEMPAYVPQPSPPPAIQEQRRQTNYDNRPESESSDGVGERLLGMGRGLATIAFSPLNLLRGVVTGCNWICTVGATGGYGAIGIISAGAALGSFATCADAINGSLDMVTVGYYGDWLYDSKGSGKPTPWVWERKWNTGEIPWINRK